MPTTPERLDIQIRQTRLRREARQSAWFFGVFGGVCVVGTGWFVWGWRWSYLLVIPIAALMALWIGRLSADFEEEATRWFWRPPR